MKTKTLLPALIALVLAALPRAHAANAPLPRSTPEAQGISSQAISSLVARPAPEKQAN